MAIKNSNRPLQAAAEWCGIFEEITKEPEKSLVVSLKKTGGRTHKVGLRQDRGGGHKHYRLIDFARNKDLCAKVAAIEYDPNRSARIALLHYQMAKTLYPSTGRFRG